MSLDRNAILDALQARLQLGLGSRVTVTRRMRDFSFGELPALVVAATTEQSNEEDSAALPAQWRLRLGCCLFHRDASSAGPNPGLMELIGKIEDALQAQPDEDPRAYWTTLGGLVWHAGLVSVDSLVDERSMDLGLAMLRIEVLCMPVRTGQEE